MISDALDLPKPFGPYTLLRRLAVGGMAEVYVAKTRGIGGFEKLVAIKVIHPRFSEDEHFVTMLVEEAKISVQLNHVNIAQTFDLGCVDGTYYIAMEFIDGADAYRVGKRAKELSLALPIDVCCYVAAEICNGLGHAHRKRDSQGRPMGIVHRDVSPQNVLISFSGGVKLVDFGIAKAALRGAQTEVGVIKGKYYYMSPEQAWGDPVDARTDVFATGLVLHELLTGDMVYKGDNIPKLLDRVRSAEIASPTDKRAEVPDELSRILLKSVAKEPEDRYSTAEAFGAELTRFLYTRTPTFTAHRLVQLLGELFPEELKRQSMMTPLPEVAPVDDRGTKAGRARPAPSRPPGRGDETRVLSPASRDELAPESVSSSVIFSAGTGDPSKRVRVGEPARRPDLQTHSLPAGAARARSDWEVSTEVQDGRAMLQKLGYQDGTRVLEQRGSERDDDEKTVARGTPVPRSAHSAPPIVTPPSGRPTRSAPPSAPPPASKPPLAAPSRPLPSAPPLVEPSAGSIPDTGPSITTPRRPSSPPHVAALGEAKGAVRDEGRDNPPARDMDGPPRASATSPAPIQRVRASAGSPAPVAPTAHIPLPRRAPSEFSSADRSTDAPPFSPRERWILRFFLVGFAALLVTAAIVFFVIRPASTSLEIISVPTGATLMRDGRAVPGVTPITFHDVRPGDGVRLELRRTGYETKRESIEVAEGADRRVFVLDEVRVRLHVETNPVGAQIWVNDVRRAPTTPADIPGFSVGEQITLRAVMPGHEPVVRAITIDGGNDRVERVQLTLPPSAE